MRVPSPVLRMPHSAALEVAGDVDVAEPEAAEELLAPPTPDRAPAVPRPVAERLKAGRLRRGLSVRALAREVGVSPSLVSQIENGKANPSVGTLYAIVSALDVSLDELFGHRTPDAEPAALPPDTGQVGETAGRPTSAVMRAEQRPSLRLDSGVRWERLTPEGEDAIDFLQVTYGVGTASCPPDALLRHNGREYGLVLSGRIGATVGFDSYELGPGDSIAIDSTTPHRIWTIGDEPADVIWTVVGRGGTGPEH